MKYVTRLAVLALTAALVLAAGCACSDEPETPGEHLDDALNRAGEALEEAGEKLRTD